MHCNGPPFGSPALTTGDRSRASGECYIPGVSTFEERRRARAGWPIRAIPLEEEGRIDPRDATTVDERVALVWTLTRELWAFTGQPIPTYTRAEAPGKIIRRR